MRSIVVIVVLFSSSVLGQYGPGGPPAPWGVGGSGNRPGGVPGGGYNKPNRPSPFAGPIGNYGSKPSSSGSSSNSYDDPIPPNPNLDSSYDSHQLPAKLPILAPNGVVEIYNYVVDDLISKLEVDFKKREIDPMAVVIRPTPAGPVRVPGHLQKRPFRRPGAALYRTSVTGGAVPGPIRKKGRNLSIERSMPVGEDLDKPTFRGAGKISKAAGEDDDQSAAVPSETTPVVASASVESLAPSPTPSVTTPTTSPTTSSTTSPPEPPVAPSVVTVSIDDRSDESSEERVSFFQARSDEYFPGDDDMDVELETDKLEKRTLDTKSKTKKSGNNKKEATASKSSKESEEEDDDEESRKDKAEGKKDLETLMQRYQNKNVESKGKIKYSSKKKEEKDEKTSSSHSSKTKPDIDEDQEDDVVEDDDEDEIHDDDQDGHEPGTLQSAGNRPSGGYYPQGGPPALPAKPNAVLSGLSKMRRASDVTVSVDARSAMITARLLVGPLNVHINESVEPMERNVRATIPELEAEIILMERHGVVFLQRFTLDRAYGQDVEISIPKSKDNKKKKGTKGGSSSNNNNSPIHGPPGLDPNHPMHPAAQQRYQTKMAAHISMEVVKLLRSGNLRVNIMRTAQASMSKLKLPIKHVKSGSSKSKKTKKSEKKSSDA